MTEIKNAICTAIGAVGGGLATVLGGWSAGLVTLIIFMAIDYISGIVVAGVFHASKKTETGTLESRAGWKGLARKCMILLFVLIANRLDVVLGSSYIQDAITIGFIANELISIVENAGLMGIPLPGIITNAIDLLKKRSEPAETQENEPENQPEHPDDEELVKEILGEENEDD